jgi:hypothetical protein
MVFQTSHMSLWTLNVCVKPVYAKLMWEEIGSFSITQHTAYIKQIVETLTSHSQLIVK